MMRYRLWGWSWETHPVQRRVFTDVKNLKYDLVDGPPSYLFAITRVLDATPAIGFRVVIPHRRKNSSIPFP